MASIFDTSIEFLKGVGPQKAVMLNKDMGIFTFGDLLQHYPFRYEDRTQFYTVATLPNDASVQLRGVLTHFEMVGELRKQRLVAEFRDQTGKIELVWFKGAKWVLKSLKLNTEYVVYGKATSFNGKTTIAHPEINIYKPTNDQEGFLQPVYHTSETMKKKFLDSKAIAALQKNLLAQILTQIPETLPDYILKHYGLIDKQNAVLNIHHPKDHKLLGRARARMKFEELFYIQLKLFKEKGLRKNTFKGQIFKRVELLTTFYNDYLPFPLTGAQKKVIKEIRQDFISGKQMNRLLQGDVGSGKTIVAFIVMLMAIDNGTQSCLMAPTEILADQHYQGLKEFADILGVSIAKLTGSSKTAERRKIHEGLVSGDLKIIVGTHALLEDKVQFKNLGLSVIDEQHRFGVAQRSKLWNKNKSVFPHILVMTATPIPRTLAMTVYGDLDVSVIDEMPAGRKPIKTIHSYDSGRSRVFGFMREEIKKGRQVYVVYPLIEESEKLDLKDLTDGYESISRAFPDVPLSIVHGRMKPEDKDYEMKRFVKNETKIMVATTVIEVGVNVPNASMMIIENAERFGLAQLHQLRGRVGRGAEQSYCILMTDVKLSKEAKIRMETMVRTNNGFEIADVDLQLRGPGDMEGTQQSGVMDLLMADLAKDQEILKEARYCAENVIEKDPQLELLENRVLQQHIASLKKSVVNWGRIS